MQVHGAQTRTDAKQTPTETPDQSPLCTCLPPRVLHTSWTPCAQ